MKTVQKARHFTGIDSSPRYVIPGSAAHLAMLDRRTPRREPPTATATPAKARS